MRVLNTMTIVKRMVVGLLLCSLTRSASNMKVIMKSVSPQKSLSFLYNPKTPNQSQYVKFLNDPKTDIVVAIGPAGTGKTALACSNAIAQFKSGVYEKIIITRPVVAVEDEELGFLPGNINKKMEPWTRPVFDIFQEHYSKKEIDALIQNNKIEIAPLAYMRGRTFKNTFIIADEMQNSSPGQMLMLLTRIGLFSKMVITGDLQQSDKTSQSNIKNGLYDFIQKFRNFLSQTKKETINSTRIQLVELDAGDIERHPVILTLLDIYNDKPKTRTTQNLTVTNSTLAPNQEPLNTSNNNEDFNTVYEENDIIKRYRNDAALIPLEHQTKFMNW
jgi:phosphate starvation-inducible PhoH-like protein